MSFTSDINTVFFRLSLKDKMLFARHMDMMTRSGMQVLEALEILKKQTTNKTFIKILDDLISDVRNGHYLSVGMERYRSVFGDFFINLVRVGETSGTLSENFRYLAEEMGKQAELRSKIRGAMAYPLVILFATLGITAIMSFFIFPRILPVLMSLNVELPITTQIFISVSSFMINYGLYLFIGLILGAIAFAILLRMPAFKYRWHAVIIRMPLIGRMSTEINIINLARTLNLLLKGGVKIVQALEITSDTLSNMVYRKRIREIAARVQGGETMSRAMIDDPVMFPASFSQMCAVGENTGKLDETLLFLADFYEGELDATTKSLSNILEPALLLTMGFIVAFVAIAIMTPIYTISQSLGR